MTKESLANDIKRLTDCKKLTGNVGLYRRLTALRVFCNKYKKYPDIQKISDELADIDLFGGKNVEKMGNFEKYQEDAIKAVKLIFDFETAKKTLKACKNSCGKYNAETPETFLAKPQNVYKNFKTQKALFKDREEKCDKLQAKLDNGEIGMLKFVAEVNNIKRALVGTIKELKSYGVQYSFTNKKEEKSVFTESMFDY